MPGRLPEGWTPKQLRPLNKLIAEKVMGWRGLEWLEASCDVIGIRIYSGWYGEGPNGESHLRHSFCTDISAAWLVVVRLNDLGYNVSVTRYTNTLSGCRLQKRRSGQVTEVEEVDGTTEPLAICLAAAKALGLEVPTDA